MINEDEFQIIQKMESHIRGLEECKKKLESLRARRLGQTEVSVVDPQKRIGILKAVERFIRISVRAEKGTTYFLQGFSNNGGNTSIEHFSQAFLKIDPIEQTDGLKEIKTMYTALTDRKALNYDEIRTVLQESIKTKENELS